MIFMFVCFSLLVVHTTYGASTPPTFTLDLSLPPPERWRGALAASTSGRSWNETFGPIFQFHNESLYDQVDEAMFTTLGNAMRTHYPIESLELDTIVHEFHVLFPEQYVSFNYLAGWVYFHELAHTDLASNSSVWRECTALLSKSADGSMHHVANMDQSPPAVRNVTLHVRFVNGSAARKPLFEGVDWYWFTTGTSRMVLPGVVSVQENWRFSQLSHKVVLQDIQAGVVPQIYVFRRSLERVAAMNPPITFDEMVDEWSNTRLAAPFYIVMAGAKSGEAAIIARNKTGVAAPNGVLRMDSGQWYLVQTNYDHWRKDDKNDPRRTAAETLLEEYGAKAGSSDLGLFAVSGTFPVHNPHTAYTAVMSARDGTLLPFVRVSMCPLYPASTFHDSEYCVPHD